MAQRARGEIETDTPEQRLFRQLDYYPTPPWAARAIAHRIHNIDPEAKGVWEPACGEGHMAAPLAEVFRHVWASDIYRFGYGDQIDFLNFDNSGVRRVCYDWIITNPPFVLAADFAERSLNIAARGVVMLCRLAFVETIDRYELLFGDRAMTWLMPFAERVPMTLGHWDPKARSATAYAAFVWWKQAAAPQAPMPFAPGTKKLFTRKDDAARFAKAAPAPLFDNMALTPLERALYA